MEFNEALKKSIKQFDDSSFISLREEEDPKMIKILPYLQKINTLGFLTLESQHGNTEKGLKKEEIIERAFITGFMQRKKAERFLKNMNIYTDKNAVYVPICNGKIDLPSNLDIPLTIIKENNKVKVHTHTSLVLPKEIGDFFKKLANLKKTEDVVYVCCWDSKWKRPATQKDGLFTEIIQKGFQ